MMEVKEEEDGVLVNAKEGLPGECGPKSVAPDSGCRVLTCCSETEAEMIKREEDGS